MCRATPSGEDGLKNTKDLPDSEMPSARATVETVRRD
jgi:hypothetical protein